MDTNVIIGILIPFIGTALGAATVLFAKNNLNEKIRRSLTGFASGVMVAASVWSLLIPALEQSTGMGGLAFVPAAVGFLLGMFFLLLLDQLVPHMHQGSQESEGLEISLKKTTKLVLAVMIHNLPEGMAVGVVYAGFQAGTLGISASQALAVALGIAIQNLPEGAIVSMPLRSEGESRLKSFSYGLLSGAVEPIGAVMVLLASWLIIPVMPYLLSFAAGAMMYVVVEELIPEMSEGQHSNLGTIFFAVGFCLMMVLDVALQ